MKKKDKKVNNGAQWHTNAANAEKYGDTFSSVEVALVDELEEKLTSVFGDKTTVRKNINKGGMTVVVPKLDAKCGLIWRAEYLDLVKFLDENNDKFSHAVGKNNNHRWVMKRFDTVA